MCYCIHLTTLTCGVVAKFSAHNGGIFAIPAVVANGSPSPIETYLHSSLVLVGTFLEAQCPSGAVRCDSWPKRNKWKYNNLQAPITNTRLCMSKATYI